MRVNVISWPPITNNCKPLKPVKQQLERQQLERQQLNSFSTELSFQQTTETENILSDHN